MSTDLNIIIKASDPILETGLGAVLQTPPYNPPLLKPLASPLVCAQLPGNRSALVYSFILAVPIVQWTLVAGGRRKIINDAY